MTAPGRAPIEVLECLGAAATARTLDVAGSLAGKGRGSKVRAAACASASCAGVIRAEMVFFETPNGGAVFSTGSIAWAGSLSHQGYDNNVAKITTNVLKRFIDETPFS